MEKKKEKQIKITLKATIISIFIIIISLCLSIYLVINYFNKFTNETDEKLDYKALYKLEKLNKLNLYIDEVNYNLENYNLKYYAEKYANSYIKYEYNEKISEETLNGKNADIIHMDYKNKDEQFDDNEEETFIPSYYSYYFIKKNDIIIVASAYYINKDIYDQYKDIILNQAMAIEIPNNNQNEYESVFTDLLTQFDIKADDEIGKYKKIANEDSSYKEYEKLTDKQKEIYDEIYNNLFVNKLDKLSYSFEENIIDIDEAYNALNLDLLNMDLKNYYISADWNENYDLIPCVYDYLDQDFLISRYKYISLL